MRVTLLHVADCPLVDRVQATLRIALERAQVPASVEVVECECASPTLLVDGVDVTGVGPTIVGSRQATSCRLDLPTEDQILEAIAAARFAEVAQGD